MGPATTTAVLALEAIGMVLGAFEIRYYTATDLFAAGWHFYE